MKENYTLIAEERVKTGKGGARKVRAEGKCPAVLYGPGFESRNVKIDPKALQKLFQTVGESSLIDLQVKAEGKDAETIKVIIRDIAYPAIGSSPEHIDFYKVSLDKTITIAVRLSITGECVALTRKEGTLSQMVHEINIECLPTDIPERLELDISELLVGQALHVSDITLPEGVTIMDSADLPVLALNVVMEEEEEVEEVEAELETAAEPEVIGQDKEEAEGS